MKLTQAEYLILQGRIDAGRLKGKPQPPATHKEVGKGGIQSQIEEWMKSKFPSLWYDVKRSDKATTSRIGVPDYVGFYHGVGFAMEVKAKGNKPTAEQLGELMWADRAGAKTRVVYSKDEAVEFLESL